jgi:hypothetical protein
VAEIRVPVYLRVGGTPETCIGDICLTTAELIPADTARFLRAAADEIERQGPRSVLLVRLNREVEDSLPDELRGDQ